MKFKAKIETELTVQSFAYMAKQMAHSAYASTAHYEQILNEAEKYRSALRLMQRDVFEMAEQGWRQQTLTKAECRQVRERAEKKITHAQQAITRIVEQYAPHRMAA
jgi:hypothetical protein